MAGFASIYPAADADSAKTIKEELDTVCQTWSKLSKQLDEVSKAKAKAARKKANAAGVMTTTSQEHVDLQDVIFEAKRLDLGLKSLEDWVGSVVKDVVTAAQQDVKRGGKPSLFTAMLRQMP